MSLNVVSLGLQAMPFISHGAQSAQMIFFSFSCRYGSEEGLSGAGRPGGKGVSQLKGTRFIFEVVKMS